MRIRAVILGVCLLLALVVFLLPVSQRTNQLTSFKIREVSTDKNTALMEHRETSAFTDYNEHAWLWNDPSGWVHAHAAIESKDLAFGDKSLNLFLAAYSDVYSKFDYAHWYFTKSDNPEHQNSEIRITFRTSDTSLATDYANIVMEYTEKFLIVDYHYEGTWSWEDWRNDQWAQLTEVTYQGRIDWPWFLEHMNTNLIPRNLGGLAETIDASQADWIEAWAWPRGSEQTPEVSFAFGFNYGKQIWDISGSYYGHHTFNMNELLHCQKIQRSPYQGDDLWINFSLPNVTSITHIPATSTSSITIHKDYHPPPEPWLDHHYWDVNFQINSGIYNEISVSFDYDYIPPALQSRMTTSLYVNPYGYEFKEIWLQGYHSNIIDIYSLGAFDPNLLGIDLNFWPMKENVGHEWERRSTITLELYYPNYEDNYANVNAIAEEIENLIGIEFDNNWTDTYSWTNWEGRYYHYDDYELNVTLSQDLLMGSDAVRSTPAFGNQDLATLTEYHQYNYWFARTNSWRNMTQYRWDPLVEEIINPTKRFSGAQYDLSFDLLDEWNWLSFPHCNNYSESQFQITVPYDDYSFYPEENNGWGWRYDRWEDHWNSHNYISSNLYIYTDASSLQFTDQNNQPNGVPFEQFGVTFDYAFHDDSEDLNSPHIGMYYYNETSGHEDWDTWALSERYTFSGTDTHLHIRAHDQGGGGLHQWGWPPNFWNGTDWEPRFGSSGIRIVNVTAYYSDLPVDIGVFSQELPITLNWENNGEFDYIVQWNTLNGFVDGEWTIVAYTEDNNGHSSTNTFTGLTVDNYDEIICSDPLITLLSAENTAVSGTHTVEFEVTDDIGVFAVVLTIDGSGWILEDENNDDIYEFNWETLDETENSIHYFTVTVWDMDGHKVIYDFWLQVDNILTGNPPTGSIISPSVSNQILTGMHTFKVSTTDDIGILSVMMRIDERADLIMDYNATSGLYERTYYVSSLSNGEHWLYVTITDKDENQHTLSLEIPFKVVGGVDIIITTDPPEWDSSRSTLPVNLTKHNYMDYIPVSGEIYFKVALKDDMGIAEVAFRIYEFEDFDSSTGEPSMDDTRLIIEDKMNQKGIDGDWDLYEYTWDSSHFPDNYYVAEIDAQDGDTIANHCIIRIVVETDNFEEEDPPKVGIPGYQLETLIFALLGCFIVKSFFKRDKKEK
ncbi:MAG: hypothetical protein ACFFCQ_03020 [Promethearchaeota archaeon]